MPRARQSSQAQPKGDYGKPDKVKLLIDRCKGDARDNLTRTLRDQADLLGLLFYRGGAENQWVVFDHAQERWVPRPTEGEGAIPQWVPRCVFNHYAVKIDGITSLMNGSIPARVLAPRTNDDEDQATADVGEQALPALEKEIGYDDLKRRMHLLIALTHACAVVYYYDNDAKYGTEEIPDLQCTQCGEYTTPLDAVSGPSDAESPTNQTEARCPTCGGDVIEATDPKTGKVLGKTYNKGKLCADLWSSFEYSTPSSARVLDADTMPWVLGHAAMDKDEAAHTWSKYAREIREQAGHISDGLAEQYAETMRALSSPRGAGGTYGYGGRTSPNNVLVYRLLHDPITDEDVDFPEGLYVVQVGDVIVESGPLPLTDDDGRPKKNIIFRQFADTPGTPFGKPPADDLVPLQQAHNLTNTLIFLILMHHASPTTWVPSGVTIEDDISGMPGLTHRYSTLVQGERPFTERGVNPPEGLYKYSEMIEASMDAISKLNAILQGERPAGDPTLGEVERLREQGQAMFRTPIDLLVEFERKQSTMLLQLARQTAWAPRFARVMGENGRWEISQFTSADLGGRIDIDIEPASAWPKSPSAELMRLRQGFEMGLLNAQADPELQVKLLNKLDLSWAKPSVKEDENQIARELDRWKAAKSAADIFPPKPEPLINVPMHFAAKVTFLKSEIGERLAVENGDVFSAMVRHVMELQHRMQQQQMAQMAAQGGAGSGVGPAAGPPAKPSAPPPPPGQGATAPGGPNAGVAPEMPQGPTGPSADDLIAADQSGGGLAGPMTGPAGNGAGTNAY